MTRKILLPLLFLFAALPAHAGPDWSAVSNWVYQLTNYKDAKLDQIANGGFDLAVIDLARDGHSDFFTSNEIAAVHQKNTLVLAYFEIGAIENYRPEWPQVAGDLKLHPVQGWPKERLVRFWDERWWPIVQGRVDQALRAGFDGAYLDMITAYEEIPQTEMKREELAHKMVDLVARVSQYARSKNPDFKIVPQNCPELYSWNYWEAQPNEKYIKAIDGIGMEEMFYLAHDKPARMKWCEENRQNALAIKRAGKLVLAVDYAKNPTNIADAFSKARALGFIPYVSTRALDSAKRGNQTKP
jgi:cysteinyl-tRNA synthetase